MNFEVEFHRPKQLPNPQPKYEELLRNLYNSIGREQLEQRLEFISSEWALNSGYYFEARQVDNKPRFVFVHVSLNPKDF